MVLGGILVACLAAGGTVAMARSKNVPRSIVVMAILAGWVPFALMLFWLTRTDAERQLTLVAGLGWTAFVAAGVWFISGGARQSKPTWPWVCPDCRYANSRGVLRCEACGCAWDPQEEPDEKGAGPPERR